MRLLRRIERDAYLVSRTAGDVNAIKRHRLGKRLARRYVRRKYVWRALRKLGF